MRSTLATDALPGRGKAAKGLRLSAAIFGTRPDFRRAHADVAEEVAQAVALARGVLGPSKPVVVAVEVLRGWRWHFGLASALAQALAERGLPVAWRRGRGAVGAILVLARHPERLARRLDEALPAGASWPEGCQAIVRACGLEGRKVLVDDDNGLLTISVFAAGAKPVPVREVLVRTGRAEAGGRTEPDWGAWHRPERGEKTQAACSSP